MWIKGYFFHFNDTCFFSRRLLFDNLKSKCSSILLTFYKNLIFETIPLFSNSATIYILWFCSITLPLKELDLGLSECIISSNDQIGKILSWEKTFINPLIKWFNKISEYTCILGYTTIEYTNLIPVMYPEAFEKSLTHVTGGLRQTAKRPSLIESQNLGVHNSIQS